jgi:hypothetical protein
LRNKRDNGSSVGRVERLSGYGLELPAVGTILAVTGEFHARFTQAIQAVDKSVRNRLGVGPKG